MLSSSVRPLSEAYDLAMLDLDGVVYIGGTAVPGAAGSIASARHAGMRLAFVTNNAARPPREVAVHLRELGIDCGPDDVVTSAQAAASVLRERFGAGAKIAALGGRGLTEALEAAELQVVDVDGSADAAVTGYGPEVRWKDVMRLATRVRGGLPWVASNTDGSLPTSYGVAPGHGVLVDMISRFAGVEPTVAGKPAPPLLEETIRRVGGERPLMVGDRLDTDIEGGTAVGVDTLLVMTGVTGLPELASAPIRSRPTYVGADLSALLEHHGVPEMAHGAARLGGWSASVRDGVLEVTGDGGTGDWWRVVAGASWKHLDTTGSPADVGSLAPPPVASAT